MIRLRGHHLICLHFFNGRGYDERFIESLSKTVGRASLEGVEIVAGPDDVCGCCPHLVGKRCSYTPGADEEISAMDREALRLLGVSRGTAVSWDELCRAVPGIFTQWYGAYCEGCDWRKACEEDQRFARLQKKVL